ncbi:TonB-dependent receptor domain-containing protein [Geojedonia litorea]|uniref:TonB-dependent receptor domain-containing protein n=1 Tax=Geojedonia litorea TaxID=1268269 RepID=A0ABV9N0A5_9FLAO
MLRPLCSFLAIAITAIGYSQHIKGKVVESTGNAGLSLVHISSNNLSITSESDGAFEVQKPGLYTFKKSGYITKTLELITDVFYIIQLEQNPSELNEIIISVANIPEKLKNNTTSISLISAKDIQRFNTTNYNDILNRSPGVFMQSGALNTNRITIRGIGSRTLFGTSKIRAYFKDIPLTDGSGDTTAEDLELSSIARLEIIKGATSSVYGAGLGGVIHLIPENAMLNETRLKTEMTLGSFGLMKGVINLNHGTEKNSFKTIYSTTHSDGFRQNNEYNRETFSYHSNHFINSNNELSVLGNFIKLKAYIPSSLNEQDYKTNPESAASNWQQAKGFEDSKRGIFGVSWNHNYSADFEQKTSVFGSFRDAYEPRPFNILKEHAFSLGMRSSVLGTSHVFKKTLNWTVGFELFNDYYKYQTFENHYANFPEGTGSVQGDMLSDFKEHRNYYNLFLETQLEASKSILFSFGLNFNKTAYALDDRFPSTSENPDQSGDYKFKNILSPKIGMSYAISTTKRIYSNISHGFSPITLSETLLPDGNINPNLKPETGWNLEIGTRGSSENKRLWYDLSIYRMAIKNLLVSRRSAEDEFIGINAGKTRHDGLEFALNYALVKKTSMNATVFVNGSFTNFKFKTFMDDTNDYSGNELTGVPSELINVGIDLDFSSGFYGTINFQHVGKMPITDSNALYTSPYSLTNLKSGFQHQIFKNLNLNIFIGLNNSFNETYASQVLINATGFGNSAPRYYYPGNPINFYSGIYLNYIF